MIFRPRSSRSFAAGPELRIGVIIAILFCIFCSKSATGDGREEPPQLLKDHPQWRYPFTNKSQGLEHGLTGMQGAITVAVRPARRDITLSIVTAFPRLASTMAVVDNWDGPISLALLIARTKINELYWTVHTNPKRYKRTEIHLIIARTDEGMNYTNSLPLLWNLAFDAAQTDYVMPMAHSNNTLPSYLYPQLCRSVLSTAVGKLLTHMKTVLAVGKDALHHYGAFVISKRKGLLPDFQQERDGRPLTTWAHALKEAGFQIIKLGDSVSENRQPTMPHMAAGIWWTDAQAAYKNGLPLEPGLWAYSNFITPAIRVSRAGISMISQLSTGKVKRLALVASGWGGPMSVSIFVGVNEVGDLVIALREHAKSLQQVSIHLIMFDSTYEKGYPINLLRNLALDSADTDLVFLNDIDFVPSPQTRYDLVDYASRSPWKARFFEGRAALIIPAFEKDSYGLEDDAAFEQLPQNRPELLKMISRKRVKTFHQYWIDGHASTDFPRWLGTPSGNEPYQTMYRSLRFEPYVVVARRQACWRLPKYWDFRGRGWNKAEWFVELNASGFEFFVATGDTFLVHMNHPRLEDDRKPEFRDNPQKLLQFQEYIRWRYGVETGHIE